MDRIIPEDITNIILVLTLLYNPSPRWFFTVASLNKKWRRWVSEILEHAPFEMTNGSLKHTVMTYKPKHVRMLTTTTAKELLQDFRIYNTLSSLFGNVKKYFISKSLINITNDKKFGIVSFTHWNGLLHGLASKKQFENKHQKRILRSRTSMFQAGVEKWTHIVNRHEHTIYDTACYSDNTTPQARHVTINTPNKHVLMRVNKVQSTIIKTCVIVHNHQNKLFQKYNYISANGTALVDAMSYDFVNKRRKIYSLGGSQLTIIDEIEKNIRVYSRGKFVCPNLSDKNFHRNLGTYSDGKMTRCIMWNDDSYILTVFRKGKEVFSKTYNQKLPFGKTFTCDDCVKNHYSGLMNKDYKIGHCTFCASYL
jgi:hypothetical protein